MNTLYKFISNQIISKTFSTLCSSVNFGTTQKLHFYQTDYMYNNRSSNIYEKTNEKLCVGIKGDKGDTGKADDATTVELENLNKSITQMQSNISKLIDGEQVMHLQNMTDSWQCSHDSCTYLVKTIND